MPYEIEGWFGKGSCWRTTNLDMADHWMGIWHCRLQIKLSQKWHQRLHIKSPLLFGNLFSNLHSISTLHLTIQKQNLNAYNASSQTPKQMIFMTPVPSFYTEKLVKVSSWDTVQKLYHTCTNVEPIWAKYLKCICETNIFFKNFLPVWQSLRSCIHKPFLLLIIGLFHITCHCWS